MRGRARPSYDTAVHPTPAPNPASLRQVLRRAMSLALPRRLFMTSGPRQGSTLALTFDDGPHPEHTPAILDRLAALGVKATFFVVGKHAVRWPEVVRRIVAEGHELGHHSFDHREPHATSAGALLGEARRTSAFVAGVVGRAPRLFRPPHGKLTPAKLAGLWALGQTVVLWSQDPKDYLLADPELLRAWFAQAPLEDGDIVLLHDNHAHVSLALDALVARARERGLRFVTPTEWLDG